MFYGGLANAFANITTVESDLSILKWEKDDFRQSMMTLEGIFHAKQHRVVMGIVVPIGFDDGVGAQWNEQMTLLQFTSRKLTKFKAISTFYILPILKIFGRWIWAKSGKDWRLPYLRRLDLDPQYKVKLLILVMLHSKHIRNQNWFLKIWY